MDELFTSLRSDTDRVGVNGLQVTESHCDFEGTGIAFGYLQRGAKEETTRSHQLSQTNAK